MGRGDAGNSVVRRTGEEDTGGTPVPPKARREREKDTGGTPVPPKQVRQVRQEAGSRKQEAGREAGKAD